MSRYPHIVRYVLNTPWAITSERMLVIMDLLAFYAAGNKFTAEEVQERIGAVQRPAPRATGAVAVLPITGIIAHRAGLLVDTSGGTSTDAVARQFREFLADDRVGSIVLDVDSPGGTVDGVDELSEEIYRARGQKPIVAVANSLAASAAYWIASAADEVVVTPTGEVGSIGVLAAHEDASAYYEAMGVKTTLISAGKYKTEGNPYEPLSDEAREHLQDRVNEYYGMFTAAVARNRGVGIQTVRTGFGEGRVVGAKAAVGANMANRVATLDETITRLQTGRRSRAQMRAELDRRERRLRAVAR